MHEQVCGIYIFPSSAATGKYVVLSGQHSFEAARRIAEKAETDRKPIPNFCSHFRCLLLKQDTDVETRELIAGLEQSRQANVMCNSLAVKAKWFLREWERMSAQKADIDKTSVLNIVYMKMGCTPSNDGVPVCRKHVLTCISKFVLRLTGQLGQGNAATGQLVAQSW